MGAKKGNGHDPLLVRKVEVLEELRGDVQGLRSDVKELKSSINTRLDHVSENTGAHYHERRLAALEERVGRSKRS